MRLLAHWERGAASPSSLLAIRIHTGRRHQIRAHLQSSGAPSVADHRYGFTQVVLRSKGGRRELDIERFAEQNFALRFPHHLVLGRFIGKVWEKRQLLGFLWVLF